MTKPAQRKVAKKGVPQRMKATLDQLMTGQQSLAEIRENARRVLGDKEYGKYQKQINSYIKNSRQRKVKTRPEMELGDDEELKCDESIDCRFAEPSEEDDKVPTASTSHPIKKEQKRALFVALRDKVLYKNVYRPTPNGPVSEEFPEGRPFPPHKEKEPVIFTELRLDPFTVYLMKNPHLAPKTPGYGELDNDTEFSRYMGGANHMQWEMELTCHGRQSIDQMMLRQGISRMEAAQLFVQRLFYLAFKAGQHPMDLIVQEVLFKDKTILKGENPWLWHELRNFTFARYRWTPAFDAVDALVIEDLELAAVLREVLCIMGAGTLQLKTLLRYAEEYENRVEDAINLTNKDGVMLRTMGESGAAHIVVTRDGKERVERWRTQRIARYFLYRRFDIDSPTVGKPLLKLLREMANEQEAFLNASVIRKEDEREEGIKSLVAMRGAVDGEEAFSEFDINEMAVEYDIEEARIAGILTPPVRYFVEERPMESGEMLYFRIPVDDPEDLSHNTHCSQRECNVAEMEIPNPNSINQEQEFVEEQASDSAHPGEESFTPILASSLSQAEHLYPDDSEFVSSFDDISWQE